MCHSGDDDDNNVNRYMNNNNNKITPGKRKTPEHQNEREAEDDTHFSLLLFSRHSNDGHARESKRLSPNAGGRGAKFAATNISISRESLTRAVPREIR